jgi:hypothetical protein
MSSRFLRTLLAVSAAVGLGSLSDAAEAWWTSSPAPAANALDPVFGPGSEFAWSAASGTFTVSRVESLPFPHPGGPGGLAVLTAGDKGVALEGRTRYPSNLSYNLWLRLPSPKPAVLTLARRFEPSTNLPPRLVEKNFRLGLSPTVSESVSTVVSRDGKPLHDLEALSAKLDWKCPWANSFNYEPRAYTRFMPGWEQDFRARIEHDMAAVPALSEKWLNVRAELAPDQVRFWLDDRLVATKSGEPMAVDGSVRIDLPPGAQLALFSSRPLEPTPGFQPIPLGGYVNGLAFQGQAKGVDPAALPEPGRTALIDGIPFVFPGRHGGADHLDIARSYLREANAAGYLPANVYRFAGSRKRDSARIQLRVPNGPYEALYLVAAAEEKPDTLARLTVQFYRPDAGFGEAFGSPVPLASAKSGQGDVKALPVRLANGKTASLWLVRIPLDPGRLSSFADLDIVELELTKDLALFRSYPDPISYGWHPAGLPSSVQVYAATLARSPWTFAWTPSRFGHVWTAPEAPAYTADLVNDSAALVTGVLRIAAVSFDGTDSIRQVKNVAIPPAKFGKPGLFKIPVALAPRLNGHYTVEASVEAGGRTWAEKRSFVRLAPDTRAKTWTGKGAMFGFWSYMGGHHTPKAEHIIRLMSIAGARNSAMRADIPLPPDVKILFDNWSDSQAGAWEVSPQRWLATDPVDPVKVAAFQKDVVDKIQKFRSKISENRRPDHIYFYPEPHISARLSAGNVPDYWNEKPYVLTPEETNSLTVFYRTSLYAAEAIRRELPGLDILIPWGDPGFVWPLLRAGFPTNLVDGSGVDIPGFERIPERQLHEQDIHRLYTLRQEYARVGITNPIIQYCEGIFVPTEPGAVDYREQMDIYQRWTLLSMGYGVKRFYSGWFAFDCGNYYGAEHYGGCGIQRRIPYCDPKPAYAAYATMTDKLNEAEFDGWLPTGSHNTYALRFRNETRGSIYALWSLRGVRSVTLQLSADAVVRVTDSMNNGRDIPSTNRLVTFDTDPSVRYVTFVAPAVTVAAVTVGEPRHPDSVQPADAAPVADLGDGSWRFTNERDGILESNHWAIMHYPGRFSASFEDDPARGRVLVSTLEKQEVPHELMPWYNVLRPAKPVVLPGAPSKLGLWARGAGDWGRVIYVLRDAAGERWTSIGTQDQYNCDDSHSWSMFCFDGWRFLEFELPGHTGWDRFRKAGTTWWRGGDGGDPEKRNVVDLPLTLEAVIVEQRTHILYVNDIQPVATNRVALGGLFALYDSAADRGDQALRVSRLRMPLPEGAPPLPNPIAAMAAAGKGSATAIQGLRQPDHYYDGTRMHVDFREAPGAAKHFLWVGAYPDGRGAVNLTPTGLKSGDLVRGLRPGVELYYWIVWQDAAGVQSPPSPAFKAVTVDNFKEK